MKGLLLSEEFDDVPNTVRDDLDHKAILIEGQAESIKESATENEKRIAELSEGYSPSECWAIDDQGSDLWRTTGIAPTRNAYVIARADSIETLVENIFHYEDSDAPRKVLQNVTDRLGRCPVFKMTNSMGTFEVAVVDRTAEIGLSDTVVFSDELDDSKRRPWFMTPFAVSSSTMRSTKRTGSDQCQSFSRPDSD